jgi:tRNA-2-methylthio-N6-dimethylallyladenosine synthase
MRYHIWTEGCQMNDVDSQRLAARLEQFAYEATPHAAEADLIILNTCVVRQSAEDKAYGRLNALRAIKKQRPEVIISLMGCLVGFKENLALQQRFPIVDVFCPPSNPEPLLQFLAAREGWQLDVDDTSSRYAAMDEDFILPVNERGRLVSAFIPVVLGCSHACTYCIIPYRRGAEESRPSDEILAEAQSLVNAGVREITLLGQIVDRYGKDKPGYPSLAQLLRQLHSIDGLLRLRFLTSHPNWMTEELLDTVAELPKIMPHIEVPVQAGDNEILSAMHRNYTVEQYRNLISQIRSRIPGVSIATDIIIGFPGETEAQFQHTYDLLAELKMDVAHLARYSTRPGTLAQRILTDDVPDEEKWRRFRLLEDLQEKIAAEIHARYLNQWVDVLFEEKVKKRWRGRTPTNKLVFVETETDLRGKLLPVKINWTGPWSMIGTLS